jgi:hypothetical protein
MVFAEVLIGVFDSEHISDVFYYADDRVVTSLAGANATNSCVTHIVASLAIAYLCPHPCDCQCQSLGLSFVLLEQMER